MLPQSLGMSIIAEDSRMVEHFLAISPPDFNAPRKFDFPAGFNPTHTLKTFTPLQLACAFSNLEIVKMIVRAGSDVVLDLSADDTCEEQPLQIAMRWSNFDVFTFLLETGRADPNNSTGKYSCHPVLTAMTNETFDDTTLLLRHLAGAGATFAARRPSGEMLKRIQAFVVANCSTATFADFCEALAAIPGITDCIHMPPLAVKIPLPNFNRLRKCGFRLAAPSRPSNHVMLEAFRMYLEPSEEQSTRALVIMKTLVCDGYDLNQLCNVNAALVSELTAAPQALGVLRDLGLRSEAVCWAQWLVGNGYECPSTLLVGNPANAATNKFTVRDFMSWGAIQKHSSCPLFSSAENAFRAIPFGLEINQRDRTGRLLVLKYCESLTFSSLETLQNQYGVDLIQTDRNGHNSYCHFLDTVEKTGCFTAMKNTILALLPHLPEASRCCHHQNLLGHVSDLAPLLEAVSARKENLDKASLRLVFERGVMLCKKQAEIRTFATFASSLCADNAEKLHGHMCVICLSAVKTRAALPCGHLLLCNGCYDAQYSKACLPNCPICRTQIKEVVKIYQ